MLARTERPRLVVSSLVALLFFAPVPPPRSLQVYLGVQIRETPEGLRIETVFNQSPALEAGLVATEMLLAIDDKPVKSEKEFVRILKSKKPEELLRLTVTNRLSANLIQSGDLPANPGTRTVAIHLARYRLLPYLGTTSTGNKIMSVVPDTPAARAGLQPNDVVIAIDGVPTLTPKDYHERLFNCKPGQTVKMKVQRADREEEIKVTMGKRPGY